MSDEYQNIVVIGGSVAGHEFVNLLTPNLPLTHRILLIDANDYAYWPIASLRGAVVPGWEKRITAKLSTNTVFASGTPHQVIAPNKVVELKEGSVVLEKPFEGSTEVPFFKCIVATGALQPNPMRPAPGATLAETEASLVKYQKGIGKATKVVIVGGGAVGSELAGEIRSAYPATDITVVHDGARLIQPPPPPSSSQKPAPGAWALPKLNPKLGSSVEKIFKDWNINVILNDRVAIPSNSEWINKGSPASEWDGSFGLQDGVKEIKTQSGKKLKADFVFLSVGNRFNSGLVGKADEEAVVGGMVWVDEFYRIKSSNPKSILTSKYYAIGDCCSAPGTKTSMSATSDAAYCSANILLEVKGGKLKPFKGRAMNGMVIALGPEKATGYMGMPLFGDVFFPNFMLKGMKSQDLFVKGNFWAMFKGEEKVGV